MTLQQSFLDRLQELCMIHRLWQIRRCTGGKARCAGSLVVATCDDDDGNRFTGVDEPLQEIEAAKAGHMQIEQRAIGTS